jgi:predicted RNA binding protein YcfA (HicA-like mRNA interferase family)
MINFLVRHGWVVLRIRGSHYFLEGHGLHTCVPVHGNRPLKIGTLRSIPRDIQMSPAEFERRWQN